MTPEEFLRRVAELEAVAIGQARDHASAVFDTLREAIRHEVFLEPTARLPFEDQAAARTRSGHECQHDHHGHPGHRLGGGALAFMLRADVAAEGRSLEAIAEPLSAERTALGPSQVRSGGAVTVLGVGGLTCGLPLNARERAAPLRGRSSARQ